METDHFAQTLHEVTQRIIEGPGVDALGNFGADLQRKADVVKELLDARAELRAARENVYSELSEEEKRDLIQRSIIAVREVYNAYAQSGDGLPISASSLINEVEVAGYLASLDTPFHQFESDEIQKIKLTVHNVILSVDKWITSLKTDHLPSSRVEEAKDIIAALVIDFCQSDFVRSLNQMTSNVIDPDALFTYEGPFARAFSSRMLRHNLSRIPKGTDITLLSTAAQETEAALLEDRNLLHRTQEILEALGFRKNRFGEGVISHPPDYAKLEKLGPPEGIDRSFWAHKVRELPNLAQAILQTGARELEPGFMWATGTAKTDRVREEIEHFKQCHKVTLDMVLAPLLKRGIQAENYNFEVEERRVIADHAFRILMPLLVENEAAHPLAVGTACFKRLQGLTAAAAIETALECAEHNTGQHFDSQIEIEIEGARRMAARYGFVDPLDPDKLSRTAIDLSSADLEEATGVYEALLNHLVARAEFSIAKEIKPIADSFLDSATHAFRSKLTGELPDDQDPVLWQSIRDALNRIADDEIYKRFATSLTTDAVIPGGLKENLDKVLEGGSKFIGVSLVIHAERSKLELAKALTVRSEVCALADPKLLEGILPQFVIERAQGGKVRLDSDEPIEFMIRLPDTSPFGCDEACFLDGYRKFLVSQLTTDDIGIEVELNMELYHPPPDVAAGTTTA